jgi:hypothetical protein
MDVDRNKVVTARVAPKFLLGDAEVTLGLSAIGGALPNTHLINVLSMDVRLFIYHIRQAMDMTGRTALDSTYRAYVDTERGELAGGVPVRVDGPGRHPTPILEPDRGNLVPVLAARFRDPLARNH